MDESGDVDGPTLMMRRTPEYLLSQVLEPVQQCLGAVTSCQEALLGDEDASVVVEKLLPDLKREGKTRSMALQQLYMLTNGQQHQLNRRSLICTSRFNLMMHLAPSLSTAAAAADRRKALLVVANLCIPIENKAVILLGDPLHDLLPALLEIIRNRLEESYLALACLFNLSQLDDGKQLMLQYTAIPVHVEDLYSNYKPFDHPYCVLRTLEKLLSDYTPFLAASTSVSSVQGESFRWSMATLRHLVTNTANACAVATQTTIPSIAMNCLDLFATSIPLHKWTRDSLPDSCLMFLVHLAQHDEGLKALRETDYDNTLKKIHGGGIHELRAKTLWGVLRNEHGDDDFETVDNRLV